MHLDTHESRRLFLQAIITGCVVISCQALKHRIKALEKNWEMIWMENKEKMQAICSRIRQKKLHCVRRSLCFITFMKQFSKEYKKKGLAFLQICFLLINLIICKVLLTNDSEKSMLRESFQFSSIQMSVRWWIFRHLIRSTVEDLTILNYLDDNCCTKKSRFLTC